MKKIYNNQYFDLNNFFFLLFLGIGLSLLSCNDEEEVGSPLITKVTRTEPQSIAKDSTFTSSFPNKMIIIHGENFNDLKNVYFNGQDAYFNRNYITNKSIIITIPADAPTVATDAEAPDNVRVVTAHGESNFSFQLLVDAPQIYSVSNEFAKEGAMVSVYGTRFYVIDKVLFYTLQEDSTLVGVEGTDISVIGDSILNVRVPENLTTKGYIAVFNQFGAGSQTFRNEAGMISNFDDKNPYSWGATSVKDDSEAFPGNEGQYVTLEVANIGGGNWSWWEGGRSINLNATQLLAVEELDNEVEDYVMKFEIFVKESWAAGTLIILPNENQPWQYVHLYRPWQIDVATTKPYITEGWTTVTIPLDQFKNKKDGQDGTGDSSPNLAALLGASGNAPLNFKFVNMGTVPVENLTIAIDNIRIIRTN